MASLGLPFAKAPHVRLHNLLTGFGVFAKKPVAIRAEGKALRGATAVLARTRAVAIDTGPERLGMETHAPVAEILTAAGFRVFRDIRKGRKITFGLRP